MLYLRPPVMFGENTLPRAHVATATDEYSPGDMYDYMVWKGFPENVVAAIIADPSVNKRELANALTTGYAPNDALNYARQYAASGAVAHVAEHPVVSYTPPPQAAPAATVQPTTTAPPTATTSATIPGTDTAQPHAASSTLLGVPYLYWAAGAGALYLLMGQ